MFVTLAEAIEGLDIPVDGAALGAVLDLLSILQAKIAVAVAEFDKAGLWDLDAATSMSAWLRNHGLDGAPATRLTRTARRVGELPGVAAAWADGKLSMGQVDAIVAGLRDEAYTRLFAEHEQALLPEIMRLSVAQTVVFMAEWRQRADAVLDRPEPAEHEREMHLSKTINSRFVGTFDYDPVAGELTRSALRLAMTEDVEGEPRRTHGQRLADAHLDICRFFLDHQHHRPANRHRPHLNVIVQSDGNGGWKGQTVDRVPLAKADVEALVCDSVIHRCVADDTGAVLDLGTGVYAVSPAIFNALLIRDRGCRFPGCDRPPQWTEAHHVNRFPTGPTSTTNTVLLCSRHHHRVHHPHWHAEMTAFSEFRVTDPNGVTRSTRPPGTLSSAVLRTSLPGPE